MSLWQDRRQKPLTSCWIGCREQKKVRGLSTRYLGHSLVAYCHVGPPSTVIPSPSSPLPNELTNGLLHWKLCPCIQLPFNTICWQLVTHPPLGVTLHLKQSQCMLFNHSVIQNGSVLPLGKQLEAALYPLSCCEWGKSIQSIALRRNDLALQPVP